MIPEARPTLMRTIREYLPQFDNLPRDFGRYDLDSGFWCRGPRLGVEVSHLSDQLAEYFGVEGGLLVTSVEPGSAAEAASLRAGDVILAIDGAPVKDLRSLRQRLADLASSTVFGIQIMRDRREMTLEGRMVLEH